MSYSFLRESKLYIVYGGNKYRIYTTSAITFNQTFAEDAYSVKTLHDQSKMFEGSSVTKANPASFSFDVPLTEEEHESIIVDLACDLVATAEADIETQQLKSFDIYVQTGSSTFKLEGAVITGATFDFVPTNQFQMRLEGQGKKLTRAGSESFTIPGSGVSGSDYTSDPLPLYHELGSRTRIPLIVYPVISVDSLDMSSIISCNLQIQNEITWTPYTTLNDSLEVTDSSNAMFPTTYTLGKRIISGEIRQYQTDNNVTQFNDFNTSSALTIKAIKVGNASNATPFFQVDLDPIMYTARVQPADVYSQSYDFRSLDNTTLDTRIRYS